MKSLALERDKAEVLGRLRNLRADSVGHWGRMSVHQMVCHLGDAFRMAVGQKPVKEASSLFQRTILKGFALYVPLPWPGGKIPTSPELDQQGEGTRPRDFAADVAQVVALVDLMTAPNGSAGRPPHPVFGPMSESAWLRWGYLHTDHHLRQFGA